jgi:hypothetical protein
MIVGPDSICQQSANYNTNNKGPLLYKEYFCEKKKEFKLEIRKTILRFLEKKRFGISNRLTITNFEPFQLFFFFF